VAPVARALATRVLQQESGGQADALAPVRLRCERDDRVERARDEVGELELDDRAQPANRHSNCHTD